MATQKETILSNKKASKHGQYWGKPPVFKEIRDKYGVVVGYKKVAKGIPFVRIAG
jgi:hypothetical protein